MEENFCKLTVTVLHYNMNYQFCFLAKENTTIRDFYIEIGKLIYNYEFWDEALLENCWFINYGKVQKAVLDYNLMQFLKNFYYNPNNIVLFFGEPCGKGGDFTIDKTIKIQINANEPKHNNPHVHISRPYMHNKYYRLDINTLSQMKNDAESWKKEFSLKERLLQNALVKIRKY